MDLLRSRVEDYVDAVRCDRTLSSEDVAVAAKLPALNDPLGDRVGQLRLGVVKHGLQGKLQGHSTFEVVSAKYRVVDLDRAVYRADQHCQPLTVIGGAAHGIFLDMFGSLGPINTRLPEAALGIQPQYVFVVARKQQLSSVVIWYWHWERC